MTPRAAPILALLALFVVGGALLVVLLARAPVAARPVEIAGYATRLGERSRGQRHNARLAAQALDGTVIAPGAVFSFNRTVQSWSLDAGYVKAPVSFDGDLVPAFGGGVCQVSTTLYNAALLAGLPIVERHPHVFAPRYVPPGRDAAVAFPGIDLRFRNPFAWPLILRARANGDRLDVRLLGRERPRQVVQIEPHILSRAAPGRLTRFVTPATRPGGAWGGSARFLRGPGAAGYRVVTVRTIARRDKSGRLLRFQERLSDDTYQAMDRVVQIVDGNE